MHGLTVVGVLVLLLGWARPAQACGGCFLPATESTVVTAHRMAVSISTERTILWDQIEYQGEPGEFGWVLPVRPGAVVEVSSDAFFEALDVATQVTVTAPQLTCSGGGGFVPFGCASDNLAGGEAASFAGEGGVTVVHKGTVGPYETVTLRSTNGDSLSTWLSTNNYAVDPSVEPVIQGYADEQFDFIAIKLRPGAGVDQMKPVRVVFPGSSFTLPLRMVAAGTGPTVGITLFVLGEGRWEVQQASNVTVDEQALQWDFASASSNYTALREAALGTNGGNAWLTAHALRNVLFAPRPNPAAFTSVTFQTTAGTAETIASLYALQGQSNEETTETTACRAAFDSMNGHTGVVVDLCTGADCRTAAEGEIDSRTLRCGPLDDLAAALVGMRPANVWVTRLEAALPRSALAQDLMLAAAAQQASRNNFLYASTGTNPPPNCVTAGAVASATAPGRGTEQFAGLLAVFAPMALGMMVLRRASRKR